MNGNGNTVLTIAQCYIMSDKPEKEKADIFFKNMWDRYCELNPHVVEVHNVIKDTGETVVNDHIALRTFSGELGLEWFTKKMNEIGFSSVEDYEFPEKHLKAKYYEFSDDPRSMPKIFISELIVEEFSEEFQNIVRDFMRYVYTPMMDSEPLSPWIPWTWYPIPPSWEDPGGGEHIEPISYEKYQILHKESEYASWTYAHGFEANHFTISINNLTNFKTIDELNTFLINNNFLLNNNGGTVKGSIDEGLQQSSTFADKVEVDFFDDSKYTKHVIAGCFYEFAHRHEDGNGNLFQGFITASANRIFESTNEIDND